MSDSIKRYETELEELNVENKEHILHELALCVSMTFFCIAIMIISIFAVKYYVVFYSVIEYNKSKKTLKGVKNYAKY